MMLATRCSHCATVFRVVPDQLRVSNGLVRCGRCDAVFDATATLFDIERGHPVVLDELSPVWLEQAVRVGPAAADPPGGRPMAPSSAAASPPAGTPAAPMYRRSTDPRPDTGAAQTAGVATDVQATPAEAMATQATTPPAPAAPSPDAPPAIAPVPPAPTPPAPDIDWHAHLRERQRRAAAVDLDVDSTMERPAPEFYGAAAVAHDPEIARLLRQAAAVDEDTRPVDDTGGDTLGDPPSPAAPAARPPGLVSRLMAPWRRQRPLPSAGARAVLEPTLDVADTRLLREHGAPTLPPDPAPAPAGQAPAASDDLAPPPSTVTTANPGPDAGTGDAQAAATDPPAPRGPTAPQAMPAGTAAALIGGEGEGEGEGRIAPASADVLRAAAAMAAAPSPAVDPPRPASGHEDTPSPGDPFASQPPDSIAATDRRPEADAPVPAAAQVEPAAPIEVTGEPPPTSAPGVASAASDAQADGVSGPDAALASLTSLADLPDWHALLQTPDAAPPSSHEAAPVVADITDGFTAALQGPLPEPLADTRPADTVQTPPAPPGPSAAADVLALPEPDDAGTVDPTDGPATDRLADAVADASPLQEAGPSPTGITALAHPEPTMQPALSVEPASPSDNRSTDRGTAPLEETASAPTSVAPADRDAAAESSGIDVPPAWADTAAPDDGAPAWRQVRDAEAPLTASASGPAPAVDDEPLPRPGAELDLSLDEPSPAFIREAMRAPVRRSPVWRVLGGVAVLVLGAAAIGQAGLLWRDPLAAQWPALTPALQQLCAVDGCRVEPPRRMATLGIDHSALTRVEHSSMHQLELAVRNRGETAARLPAVELNLTDAQGRLVARKVLPPEAFELAADAAVPAGGELRLRGLLSTAGHNVDGYAIDLFYP